MSNDGRQLPHLDQKSRYNYAGIKGYQENWERTFGKINEKARDRRAENCTYQDESEAMAEQEQGHSKTGGGGKEEKTNGGA